MREALKLTCSALKPDFVGVKPAVSAKIVEPLLDDLLVCEVLEGIYEGATHENVNKQHAIRAHDECKLVQVQKVDQVLFGGSNFGSFGRAAGFSVYLLACGTGEGVHGAE